MLELRVIIVYSPLLFYFVCNCFRYDDAAEMIKKEMGFHLAVGNTRAAGRLVVAEVLVHLMREDFVAADKAFKEGYK